MAGTAFGQSFFAGASYKMNIPLADFRQYIQPTSFTGVEAEFRYFKNDWFSFGLKLGWASFYEYIPEDTYYWQNMALTAEQWNYLYVSDFNFQAHFYAPTKILIKPYLGIGLGSSFVQDYKKVGDMIFNKNEWGFSLTPEIGFLFHLPEPDGLSFFISSGYHHVFLKNEHYDYISNINLKFGIAYSGQFRKATQERIRKEKEAEADK